MSKLYDVIIVGSGPAGLTASIYASRAELDTVVIEKAGMSGGQIINTYEVDNYPGIPGISGFDLATKFREHCDKMGVTFLDGEVVKFEVKNDIKYLYLENGDCYQTKTLIIATGAKTRLLDVPGEKELSGMGVSYCATCDGAFFRNKTTVVVGGGDVAVEDAIFLARMCTKVYVVHRRDSFRAAKTLVTKLNQLDNVEIIWNSVVKKINGKELVESIEIENVESKENTTIDVNGVFIAVGNMPMSDVYQEYVKVDKGGYIIADETCETNIPGVYAVGDIRTKQLKQIITAAADGANAITTVEKYLSSL